MSELTPDHVRLLLSMQGYTVPDDDLIEITARTNALVEGLTRLESFGPLENEPWPTPIGYGHDRD